MSEAPERIVPSCVEALENYQQADMDGIMVLASRQAIHETIDAYWARVETCEKLEAKLAKAVETLKRYGGVMPIAFTPIQDGGYKARTTLAELTRGKE